MRKNVSLLFMLTILLAIMFGLFTTSPASAASHQAATPKIAQDDVFCHYTVTVTAPDLLNVRSQPVIANNIVYELAPQTVVTAFRDHTASGSGFTWRQLADGNWAATNWLSQTGSCFF